MEDATGLGFVPPAGKCQGSDVDDPSGGERTLSFVSASARDDHVVVVGDHDDARHRGRVDDDADDDVSLQFERTPRSSSPPTAEFCSPPPAPSSEFATDGRRQRRRRRWQDSPPPDAVVACLATSPLGASASSSSSSSHSLSNSLMHIHDIPSESAALRRPPEEECDGDGVAAVERARAIAMRFRKEEEEGKSVIVDASVPDNVDHARLRRDHFERERTRLGLFRLKNLEYVMRHEEGELRRAVECMDHMTQYEERLLLQKELQDKQRHELRMRMEEREIRKERRGISNDGGGGIGTMEQRRAARAREARRPDGSGPSSVTERNDASDAAMGADVDDRPSRTSLYLTNLPVDGSTNERTLRSLFVGYGRLDRVTMYRFRSTGELKGDGLVVFGRDAVEEHRARRRADDGADLVDEVCSQVSLFLFHIVDTSQNPNVGYLGSVPYSYVDLVDLYFLLFI